MAAGRWVCLDVGETLINETRVCEVWARVLGIPGLTLMAALGASVATGGDHRDAFEIVGRPDWRSMEPAFSEGYGSFRSTDLYPDALPALDGLRAKGYRLAIVANQPARRTAELRALGITAEVIAMSDELGVHKPNPLFFGRVLELLGNPDPADVAHVGDRLDNDVRPSAAAGMRAVWLRRGPWGLCAPGDPPAGTMQVSSLAELVTRVDESWPSGAA
jgi:HAD superfamily hydrolase (TIGR01549 family)